MAKRSKAIITCAVTGGGYTPTMSPHLPITPEEIAGASLAAAQAGAAMLHLHAREPHTGRPSADPDLFFQFLPRIGADTNAVVIINTGGVQGMPIEDRLAPALRAKPEMCSFNLGAMCIGLFPLQDRFKEWKYTWEPEHLEKSRGVPTGNTFKDVERILRDLGEGCGTRFEFECYDVGHLHNLAHLLERRLVSRLSSFSAPSVFWGALGLTLKMCFTCDASPIPCSARIMFGRSWRHAGRSRPLHWARSWEPACGWVWKTVSISSMSALPSAMQSKSPRSDAFSRSWDLK